MMHVALNIRSSNKKVLVAVIFLIASKKSCCLQHGGIRATSELSINSVDHCRGLVSAILVS